MDEETYFQNLVSNSLDGTLTELEREKLAAHLKECKACASLKRDLEQMRTAFLADTTEGNEGSAQFPPDLHQKIMQRVEQEQQLTVVRLEKPVRRMPVFTMVAVASIVVLMVLGGGLGDLFSMTDTGDRTAAGVVSSDTGDGAVRVAGGGSNTQESNEKKIEDSPVMSSENGSADYDNADAITEENTMDSQSSEYARKSRDFPDAYSDTTTGPTADAGGNVLEEDIDLAQTTEQASDTANTTQNSPAISSSETMSGATYDLDRTIKESRQFVLENDKDNETDNVSAEPEINVSMEDWAYEQDEMPIVTLPDSLWGHEVAHCYLAWGANGLPDLTGDLNLLLTTNGVSYFSLPNEMNAMAETLDTMEQAGYRVDSYESVGLEIDKKADTWLLIVAESK